MSEFERVVRSNICGDGYDAEARAAEIIEAHKNGLWNPVENGLPTREGEYYVTVLYNGTTNPEVYRCYFVNGRFRFDTDCVILAWMMGRPEPYVRGSLK